jgi:excisionase family DNA binding protein
MSEAVLASDGEGLVDWQSPRKSELSGTEAGSSVAGSHHAAKAERRTLTDIEVATRLGVSRFTVRSWRLKGVGPRFLKMGRAVRYRLEDVQEYEQRVLVNPTSR